MPAKTKVTNLTAKYGAEGAKAVANHAKDEIKTGFVQLPPGINGIARLQEFYFAEYEKDQESWGIKKGDVFLRGVGVVVEPETHAGMKVKGMKTYIKLPYCATKKATMDENVEQVMQEVRKLTGEKTEINQDNLPSVAEVLEKAQPYFRFSTSERKAQADSLDGKVKAGQVTGVWENWNGTKGLESYAPPTGMKDKTGTAAPPSTNGTSASHQQSATPPDDNAGGDTDELSELAEAAINDDAAENKLRAIAKEAGVPDEFVDAAKSWDQVVEAIREKQAEGGGGDDDSGGDADEYEPAKGDEVLYKPKGARKSVKCKVVSVQFKAQTVELVTADKSKTKYEAVPWDKVSEAE